ncbi:MAG: hypothetical protein IJY79_03025, partial [Clostridia bacterium]|nr:hypothetical protein [Clostridia bacterium]
TFADVILSYDWDKSLGITGSEDMLFRVSALEYDENFEDEKLENAKHYVSATATRDLLISRFENEQYGEGYMFVNFTDRDNVNTVSITFKECDSVAVYGGAEWSNTPEIVTLDESGTLAFELAYGEGIFVTPIV